MDDPTKNSSFSRNTVTGLWTPNRPAPPDTRAAARLILQQRKSIGKQTNRVQQAVADPLYWLQNFTKTKDPHWREAGADSAYRPFPDKPYFRPICEAFQRESVLFIEKSRDLMVSWICVGLFTHVCMTVEGIEVVMQTLKEDKAFELVDYAKTLYGEQPDFLRLAYPLTKPLARQSNGCLEFANGSRLWGMPGGQDQIRSYHPWGFLGDEVAFQPEAGECYDHAIPVCQKIVEISSAGLGWFNDFVNDAVIQ
jgi:hypothetical protein